jgi:hypothetical protein
LRIERHHRVERRVDRSNAGKRRLDQFRGRDIAALQRVEDGVSGEGQNVQLGAPFAETRLGFISLCL